MSINYFILNKKSLKNFFYKIILILILKDLKSRDEFSVSWQRLF